MGRGRARAVRDTRMANPEREIVAAQQARGCRKEGEMEIERAKEKSEAAPLS